MATATRYVNTGNGASGDGTTNETDSSADSAYVSLSAAEAGCQAENFTEFGSPGAGIIPAGDTLYIECCGSAADTTALTWGGFTINGNVVIRGNRGETDGFYDGNGVWSTSHYRLDQGSSFLSLILPDPNVTIDGLQIACSKNSGSASAIDCQDENLNVTNCRIHGSGKNSHGLYFNVSTVLTYGSATNNIIFDARSGIRGGATGAAAKTFNWYNNTIFDCTDGIGSGIDDADLTYNIKNNCIYNITTTANVIASYTTATVTDDYNAYDGSGSPPGATNDQDMTSTVTDDMTDPENATMLSRDVTPLVGGVLDANGLGNSSDSNVPTTDLLGVSRSSTAPTIGAFEYVAAGVDVAPTAGSLSLTGATPSVALKINVAPTAGSLSLTGATPSVATVTPATEISVTAGALSLAGATPSVAIKLNVSPTAGSLSITGSTPGVATKTNVTPTAGSLSITGETPSVTTKTNVSPTAGSLSLAGSTPSVALKLNVAPTAGSLSVTGATPGVATKTNVNVTGGTVSLTGATPGVEVVTPGVTAITVTAGSISLAGATPAVAIKLNVSPTAADLSITGATPSVNISKNISPTAGSISLAGATPAVALKLNVAPTAGTLALSGSTVTVVNTGDVAVTPAPARRDGGGGGRKRQQRRREFSEEELERLDVETKSVIETLYGPPTPEPAQEAPAVPDVSKERLERLVALRDAVRQDEQKIRALGARLEDLESEITFIEARREEDSLLLLLLAVE